MLRRVVGIVVVVVVVLSPWAVSALLGCLRGHEPHELDPVEMAEDFVTPGEIGEVAVDVRRGTAAERSGCGHSSSSLDDLGWVYLRFSPSGDDRTPAEKMGYMVVLEEGEPPEGMLFPSEPSRAFMEDDGVALQLSWIDGASDEQETFDFTVSVTPLDLAGNEGKARLVRIEHGGTEEEIGCSVGRLGGFGGTVLLLMILGAALGVLRLRNAQEMRGQPGPSEMQVTD